MGIFKVPRIERSNRLGIVLDESEVVFDTTEKIYYGGDGATLGGFPLGKGGGGEILVVTLTEEMISQKGFLLPRRPASASSVGFIPDGGISQRNGIDFYVNEETLFLSWEGLGLDGFLDAGERVTVNF